MPGAPKPNSVAPTAPWRTPAAPRAAALLLVARVSPGGGAQCEPPPPLALAGSAAPQLYAHAAPLRHAEAGRPGQAHLARARRAEPPRGGGGRGLPSCVRDGGRGGRDGLRAFGAGPAIAACCSAVAGGLAASGAIIQSHVPPPLQPAAWDQQAHTGEGPWSGHTLETAHAQQACCRSGTGGRREARAVREAQRYTPPGRATGRAALPSSGQGLAHPALALPVQPRHAQQSISRAGSSCRWDKGSRCPGAARQSLSAPAAIAAPLRVLRAETQEAHPLLARRLDCTMVGRRDEGWQAFRGGEAGCVGEWRQGWAAMRATLLLPEANGEHESGHQSVNWIWTGCRA